MSCKISWIPGQENIVQVSVKRNYNMVEGAWKEGSEYKETKKNRTTGVQNRPTLETVPSGEVRPKQDGEAHTSGSSGAESDGRAQTTGSGRMGPDGTETFGRSGPDDAETSSAKGPDGAETSGWKGADWHCTGHTTGSEPHARTLQTPCQSAVWVRGTWRQKNSRCRRLGRLGWAPNWRRSLHWF